MHRIMLEIISIDFDLTGQLLNTYSSPNTREGVRIQQGTTSASYRLQGSLLFIWERVLYNILIEFDIPMKVVGLIKMCLTETYRTVRVGKNLSDMVAIKNGWK